MSKKRSKDNLRKIDKQSYGDNDEIIRMVNIQKGKSYTINLAVDLQITEE